MDHRVSRECAGEGEVNVPETFFDPLDEVELAAWENPRWPDNTDSQQPMTGGSAAR